MKTPEGNPSALAEAVGMSTMIEMVGLPVHAVPLWIAARAGYALRCCVGVVSTEVWPLDISVLERGRIVALSTASADDLCDALLAGDDDLHQALDPVVELVTTCSESEFDTVASVEPAIWDGVLQVSTYQLQRKTSAGCSMSRPPSRFSASGSCCGRSTRHSDLRHQQIRIRPRASRTITSAPRPGSHV